MSIIYSIICTLFLALTISALVAPPDVYSAVIHNAQNLPIQCSIVWLEPSGNSLQNDLFTIEKKQDYKIGEKLVNMGTWNARDVIQEIHCGELVLQAPFPGVESPKMNWEFFVHSDKIVSGRLNSHLHNY